MSSPFADLGVPGEVVAVLDRAGITEPFPIQTATIPDALAGGDITGRAPTGSGKTLAFAIPLAVNVGPSRPRRPSGLVLVPTRELAEQVRRELVPLASAVGRRVTTIYGGVGYQPQRSALNRGADVVVACPGRLEDLIEQRAVDLSGVHVAVVDEADRMADMGFLPAVRRILDLTARDRQTLLFSATLDGVVDVLIRRYQRHPRRFEVAGDEGEPGTVRHLFWRAEHAGKVGLTAEVVSRHDSAIVFCRTKHGADRLTRQLTQHGVPAVAIHGNRTQPQRHRALQRFASGEVRALVATDVAARGIHVDAVGCVVHFDPPNDEKDYVHRSGRTGRAGVDGTVVSLLMHDQVGSAQRIQRNLGLSQGVDRVDLGLLGTPLIATTARPAHAATDGVDRSERRNSGGSRRVGADRNRRGGQGRNHFDGTRDAGGDRRRSVSTDRDNAAGRRGERASDERRGEGPRGRRSGQPGSHGARQTSRNRRRRYP
jgi:superfamily II DNA/RNA helicase